MSRALLGILVSGHGHRFECDHGFKCNGFEYMSYTGGFDLVAGFPSAGRRWLSLGPSLLSWMPIRANGVLSKVAIVRSDGGGEFRGGKFGDLRRSGGIKQEFTTADSPQFNGVAERALGLIETAAVAGRFHARELFPGAQLPAT